MTPFLRGFTVLFSKAIPAAILAASLVGCASGTTGRVDETADFAPVSYRSVCLLENDAVKSPKLPDAIESGLKKAGVEVKRLPSGTGPMACPFVLTYDVPSEDGLVSVIRFQTFEHGIPRVDAAGRAPAGRALTVNAVEAYVQELFSKLAHRNRPAAGDNVPSASVAPPAAAKTFRSVPSWQASGSGE